MQKSSIQPYTLVQVLLLQSATVAGGGAMMVAAKDAFAH